MPAKYFVHFNFFDNGKRCGEGNDVVFSNDKLTESDVRAIEGFIATKGNYKQVILTNIIKLEG